MPTNQVSACIKKINNGPSFSAIVDAFKYAYDKTHKMKVRFTRDYFTMCGIWFDMTIEAIEHDSRNSRAINIKGFASYENISHENVNFEPMINIRYDTRTRKGTIFFDNYDDYQSFMAWFICYLPAKKLAGLFIS